MSWPGAGKNGEGAAWHRKAVWACVACVFQSLTLEKAVVQAEKAQPLGRQSRGRYMCEQRAWEIFEVGI